MTDRSATERVAAEAVLAHALGLPVCSIAVSDGHAACDREHGDEQTEAIIAAAATMYTGGKVTDVRLAAVAKILLEGRRDHMRATAVLLARHGHVNTAMLGGLRGVLR